MQSTGLGFTPRMNASPSTVGGDNVSAGGTVSSGPYTQPQKKSCRDQAATTVSRKDRKNRREDSGESSESVPRRKHRIHDDSDDGGGESVSREENAQLSFMQAAAKMASSMGYDQPEDAQTPDNGAEMTYAQASATFLNPMGYDVPEGATNSNENTSGDWDKLSNEIPSGSAEARAPPGLAPPELSGDNVSAKAQAPRLDFFSPKSNDVPGEFKRLPLPMPTKDDFGEVIRLWEQRSSVPGTSPNNSNTNHSTQGGAQHDEDRKIFRHC